MKRVYGFKLKFNRKIVESFTFDTFEEAINKLEITLLEIYDSENFTTMQMILNTYNIESIDKESFKNKLKLNHLNHIKNFSIELNSKNIETKDGDVVA